MCRQSMKPRHWLRQHRLVCSLLVAKGIAGAAADGDRSRCGRCPRTSRRAGRSLRRSESRVTGEGSGELAHRIASGDHSLERRRCGGYKADIKIGIVRVVPPRKIQSIHCRRYLQEFLAMKIALARPRPISSPVRTGELFRFEGVIGRQCREAEHRWACRGIKNPVSCGPLAALDGPPAERTHGCRSLRPGLSTAPGCRRAAAGSGPRALNDVVWRWSGTTRPRYRRAASSGGASIGRRTGRSRRHRRQTCSASRCRPVVQRCVVRSPTIIRSGRRSIPVSRYFLPASREGGCDARLDPFYLVQSVKDHWRRRSSPSSRSRRSDGAVSGQRRSVSRMPPVERLRGAGRPSGPVSATARPGVDLKLRGP